MWWQRTCHWQKNIAKGQKFKVEDESPTEYARSSRRCFGLVQLYRTLPSAIFEFVFVFWWFTKARVSDLSSCVPCQRGYKCFLKIQQKEEIPNFRNEEAEIVSLLQSWVQNGACCEFFVVRVGASFKRPCPGERFPACRLTHAARVSAFSLTSQDVNNSHPTSVPR